MILYTESSSIFSTTGEIVSVLKKTAIVGFKADSSGRGSSRINATRIFLNYLGVNMFHGLYFTLRKFEIQSEQGIL